MKNLMTSLVLTFVLVFMGISQGALTDNMVALYHFDGNISDSAPGSSDAGTLSGYAEVNQDNVQVGTGSFESQNGAESKNGAWSFGTIPEGGTINGTNNWSITFWVNAKTKQLWRNAWAFDGGNSLRLENGGGTSSDDWRFYASGYGGIPGNSFTKQNNKWTFFALTADSSTLKVYQGFADGSLSLAYSESIDSGESLAGGNVMVLGGRVSNPADASRLLNCYLDEIGIWSRPLSSVEVQDVFDAGKAGNNIPEPATMCLLSFGGLLYSIKR